MYLYPIHKNQWWKFVWLNKWRTMAQFMIIKQYIPVWPFKMQMIIVNVCIWANTFSRVRIPAIFRLSYCPNWQRHFFFLFFLTLLLFFFWYWDLSWWIFIKEVDRLKYLIYFACWYQRWKNEDWNLCDFSTSTAQGKKIILETQRGQKLLLLFFWVMFGGKVFLCVCLWLKSRILQHL